MGSQVVHIINQTDKHYNLAIGFWGAHGDHDELRLGHRLLGVDGEGYVVRRAFPDFFHTNYLVTQIG